MPTDTRSQQLEAAFAEAETTVAGLRLRPFSLGTLNLCRQLNLTLFLDETAELTDAEKQRQLVAFAWAQSAPLHEVLAAIRTGKAMDHIAEFEFTLSIDMLPGLLAEITRISKLAAAAAVEVAPKPGSGIEEGAPPNS